MSDQARIRITIPDGPPEQQIKMIEGMRSVMETFANIAGEKLDTTPFDEAIKKVKPPTPEEKPSE